jgi:hypothetical protein
MLGLSLQNFILICLSLHGLTVLRFFLLFFKDLAVALLQCLPSEDSTIKETNGLSYAIYLKIYIIEGLNIAYISLLIYLFYSVSRFDSLNQTGKLSSSYTFQRTSGIFRVP